MLFGGVGYGKSLKIGSQVMEKKIQAPPQDLEGGEFKGFGPPDGQKNKRPGGGEVALAPWKRRQRWEQRKRKKNQEVDAKRDSKKVGGKGKCNIPRP